MTSPGSNYAPTSHAGAVSAPRAATPPSPSHGGAEAASRHHLGATRALVFGVLTTSDTHTEDDDESGSAVKQILTEAGHKVGHYGLVANSVADIREAVGKWLDDPNLEAVVTIGGTGVSSRDVTVEALAGMGGKPLEGFGDLYRMLSYQEVGPLAVLSRASLFAIQNRPVFAIPGSERACRLALSKLVVPTAEHLVDELAR
ncbi:MAG: MogA/MoaB family molybdenum cofactor biosynthesis protein [Euryarchaeota archaeon]|nr:MogA/MoaB family molybdenum cofactor biosynthesis protein [Euryarchaeota archaeon]MDE1835316.1 MogA/MoaB family molybdenum cofactor biosynthesis protein [Euryarchaeota archaeon]MDE1880587.1 MogA/MoaB family molybdenum cofactor biosynthesis protein [Euryarchaeota archaeon]MDE2043612.1 MogA/MoaB family molybdenum cofactor biosynthesis protein [Thermoplasmata archaeon]